MKINIAPDFPLPGFWSDRACAEAVYEFDGQRYYLRQMDKHILYRTADRNSVEHTLYVPCRAMPGTPLRPLRKNEKTWTPAEYPEEVFREQIRAGQNGRLALYACPAARDCMAALFFAPDGTGKFLDYYTTNNYSAHDAGQALDFFWGGVTYGIENYADILTCEWEKLLPLCVEVFMEQVWPRMRDPYVSYAELPDEPSGFTCGSYKELEHITRCICHADAGMFVDTAEQTSAIVEYHANTSKVQGGLEARGYKFNSIPLSAGAASLCRLAFTHNKFDGGTWKYSRYRENTRLKSYHLEPAKLFVHAALPSAHERAEALLTLYDWLEDKVSDRERQHLLGLDTNAT